MQHKQPKFSGILVVAVLMVLVLFFVSLSPLLAASGNKDTTYSEIYYYFENQQVTSFRLDLGTGSLEMWLKEGKAALPESNAATTMPSGGLLSMGSTDNDTLPANGGTVYDPLIASLAIDCGVKVTILGADTRTIDGKAFGTMLLLLPDDPNEAAKALSYIRSQPNITAEEVEYHA